MIFFEVLFWACIMAMLLHYVIYPMTLLVFGGRAGSSVPILEGEPTLTFIVAAYNEGKIIKEKILKDLSLDYAKDKVEYIVVSDGSSDETPRIVEGFAANGVTSLYQPVRLGKTAALNRAVAATQNELLVFSDANSFFEKDALKKLAAHFADPEIGGVSGRKIVQKEEARAASLGDWFFWRLESKLKQAQSRLGSITNADGEIFAMRRQHFSEIPQEVINDDQFLTLRLKEVGKRIVYEPEAVAVERGSKTLRDDFNVKARMVYGGLQTLTYFKSILNPFRSGFALQFHIHKTLRYFMWLILLNLFICSFILRDQIFIASLFFNLQVIYFLLVAAGQLVFLFSTRGNKVLYFPLYYFNVNLAALKGFLFFLRGSAQVQIWKKAER